MLRTLLLAISLLGFGFSVKQLISYWNYDTAPVDVARLLTAQVPAEDMNHRIAEAINNDRPDEATQLIKIARFYDYPLDLAYYEAGVAELNEPVHKLKRNSSNFLEGFLSGEGQDAAGISGAVAADFTVVGDVRDLHHQYQEHAAGRPVNELIVALSGVGIGLTVVTYGSAGSSAAAKTGASLFKMSVKTGQITRSFSRELLQKTSRVFDVQGFKAAFKQSARLSDIKVAAKQSFHPKAILPLERMAKQVESISKQTSLVDTMKMMRYVENGDDLVRLQKFTRKHGELSAGLLLLLGKGAMRSVRVLRKTLGFLLSAFASIISGLISLVLLFSGTGKAARRVS